MNYQISMSSSEINEADIQAVVDVMRSGPLALGLQTREFERLVADYVGVEHAVAVNSGTTVMPPGWGKGARLRLGVNSLVGVGAVVIRDVPDNAVVVGVPADVLRYQDAVDERV